ncbi:MAG: PLP-dependent aminotransferase family protein, partial [Alphaproteobacteria bacterium]|nr:PLP-dependent aminotransferase family protein [Alphaproteobacteria bacterium]
MRTDSLHRYEQIAGFVTALIENGTLRPGARAPSLREISRQRRASLSTALQAYRLLEDRGVLEARPQSGFYVASGGASAREAPDMSRPPARAVNVAVSDIVLKLLGHAADPRLVPLGCAIPSAELLAAGRLDRFLARAARVKGTEYNVYTAPKGDLRLRQEIARRALRWGQALAPDDIAVTCGCTEALTLALKAVAKPGDTIAVESPTYFGVLQAIEALDLKALELPTDAIHGIDLGTLEKVLKKEKLAACLFSSSFNNPLGGVLAEDKKLAILDLLA